MDSDLYDGGNVAPGELKVLVGKRVVIVEDEGVTQMQLKRIVTKAGMVLVGTANNGRHGVEVVLRERPDIVLMDINMPVLDGLSAAAEILASLKTCVIMLTAYSESRVLKQAIDTGVRGYIVKPTTQELLLPQLVQALAPCTPNGE